LSNPSASGIRLIVGLGNVGPEYERTRHNAGFWLVDRLAHQYHGSFHHERKFFGDVTRIRIAGTEVWLLKPSTYMNLSGQAVLALALFYRILPDQILVVHDELDLPPGDVRLKQGGGVAGHNGLKDIRARLSNDRFWRLRVGIGHPRSLGLQQQVADFVLHPPRREDQALIDAALDRGQDVIDLLVQGQWPQATKQLHTAAAPEKRS
jgi:PTH1 family peptidyl-tRNA hydrolase